MQIVFTTSPRIFKKYDYTGKPYQGLYHPPKNVMRQTLSYHTSLWEKLRQLFQRWKICIMRMPKRAHSHVSINMFTHGCLYDKGFPIIKKEIAKFELVLHLGIVVRPFFNYYKWHTRSHVISYHTTMYFVHGWTRND